ncbi:MAG: DUF86 domain-containing protein [bacterium]|nr:DUF86 domain-containing protein [bacterium]
MSIAIEKDVVVKRINGIQQELAELRELGKLPCDQFQENKGFELGQYHLHRALEGVFNIGSHILSRISGGQATQYSEIALKLGEHSIVDKTFAKEKLVSMAKYRNRLVHFYAEVTLDEICKIIKEDLGDFEIFLSCVKKVLENPDEFGLTVE